MPLMHSSACVVSTPCPAEGVVVYCGIVCRENDAERHARKHHTSDLPPGNNHGAIPARHPVDGRPACAFFLRGYCAFGWKCRKWHPELVKGRTKGNEGEERESEESGDLEEPIAATEAATVETGNLREAVSALEDEQVREEEEEETTAMGTEELLDPSICGELDNGGCFQERVEETASVYSDVPNVDKGDITVTEESIPDAECGSHDARAGQMTKKSRLLLRREARKTRKALRKRTLKQILGEHNGSVEEVSEELNSKVVSEASVSTSATEEESKNDAESHDDVEHISGAEDSFEEVRVLTKRERKREERRLASALKKRERQEKKMRAELALQQSSQRLEVDAAGKELLKAGKHIEAAIAFTKALSGPNVSAEKEADLYLGRSECYLALEKVSCALRDSKRAVDARADERSLRSLLTLQIMCGMTAEARETSSKVQGTVSECLEAIARIETATAEFEDLVSNGLWKGADKEIRAAAELAPHSATVLLGRAEVCMHLHQFDEGREFVRAAKRIAGNDDDCGFLYVRGLDLYYTEEFWRDADKEPEVLKAFAKTRNWKARAMATYHKAAAIKSRFISLQKLLNDGAKKGG